MDPDALWAVIACNGTFIRVRGHRDQFIPAGDIDKFRRHAHNGYVGLCPRRSNATDGQAPSPCCWVHYQYHSGTKLPGTPAIVVDHGSTRTAIFWLEKPLRLPKPSEDDWLTVANRRLHYKVNGGNGHKPPTAEPLWLMPPGDVIYAKPHRVSTSFLTALKPSPWERDAHKRPARQH